MRRTTACTTTIYSVQILTALTILRTMWYTACMHTHTHPYQSIVPLPTFTHPPTLNNTVIHEILLYLWRRPGVGVRGRLLFRVGATVEHGSPATRPTTPLRTMMTTLMTTPMSTKSDDDDAAGDDAEVHHVLRGWRRCRPDDDDGRR